MNSNKRSVPDVKTAHSVSHSVSQWVDYICFTAVKKLLLSTRVCSTFGSFVRLRSAFTKSAKTDVHELAETSISTEVRNDTTSETPRSVTKIKPGMRSNLWNV